MRLKELGLTLLATLIATTLFAQSNRDMRTRNQQQQMESQPSTSKYHLSARGCPDASGGFSFVNFIYWRAENNAYKLAFENQAEAPFALQTVGGGVIRIDPDWDPGFKVGLGWNAAYGDWDTLLRWTYYHNRSTRNVTIAGFTVGGGLGLINLWTLIGGGPLYGFSRATWRLNHNMIDWEWGRAFFIGHYLSVRPHLGLKGGWLYQDFRIRFEENSNPPLNVIFTGHDHFRGIGPRIGVDGKWRLGSWSFAVFGDLAAAFLFGKVNMRQNERVQSNATGGIWFTSRALVDKFWQLTPNVQMLLGLSWEKCFNKWLNFKLSAAWESNYYWDQFHLIPNTFTLNEPVELEGLTFEAKLDF